jgi:hypothetical protein
MDHANGAFWLLHGRIRMIVGRVALAGARWFSAVYSLGPQLVVLIPVKAGATFKLSESRTRTKPG